MNELDLLRVKLNEKRAEARKLNEENKIDEAEKVMQEVRQLKQKIEIAEEEAADEKRELEKQKREAENRERHKGKVNEVRAFTKAVMHEELTEEERDLVKTTDNAAVLPGQFINNIEVYRNEFDPLKEDCDVIPVTTKSGSKPTYDAEQNGKLKDIAEGDAIEDGTFVTNAINFEVKKVGIKVPLSAELIDDAEIEIEAAVKSTFTESSVMTENYNIIKVLNDNATAVEATDYTTIEDQMALAKPAVKKGLVTYVNEAAYADLYNKKDKNGNKMNLITVGANGKEYFNNRPIREFDSSFITPSEGKKCVIFIANPKEAVKFFDRTNGTTADKWYDHDKQINKLSVTERVDIKVGNKRSIKKIEY